MKLNELAHLLLDIFNPFLKLATTYYSDYKSINVNEHIRLEQDMGIFYYALKARELLISTPLHLREDQSLINWQLREGYRLINYALATSSLSLLPIRKELNCLKVQLEANDYLVSFLAKIDSGELPTDLVCSGHGFWHCEDGYINLENTAAKVVVYSGLGGTLANQVGVDIENEVYDKDKIFVRNEKLGIKYQDASFPRTYSDQKTKNVPNYTLVDCQKKLRPRVFELKTGRVLLSLEQMVVRRNKFTLLDILHHTRFKKRVHWAACTKVGSRYVKLDSAKYMDCNWIKEEPPRKKRRVDREEEQQAPNTNFSL